MIEFNEETCREIRAHPLYQAAVYIQARRLGLQCGRRNARPNYYRPHPDQLIEELVGWEADPAIAKLVTQEAEEIQREVSAGCDICGGRSKVMVKHSKRKPFERPCPYCVLDQLELRREVLRRHPDLAQQYSEELQRWGIVAAMVSDEALERRRAASPSARVAGNLGVVNRRQGGRR